MYSTRAYPTPPNDVQMVSEGFAQPITPALEADTAAHLSEADFCLTMHDSGQEIAFALFEVMEDMLYLAGIMVRPGYQGRLIAQTLILQAQHMTACKYLGLRTANPVMWSAGNRVCSSWFPQPKKLVPAQRLEIIQHHATQVKMAYPVMCGFYGRPLYGLKPLHRDLVIQVWWDGMCNFERADAVFCFGEF